MAATQQKSASESPTEHRFKFPPGTRVEVIPLRDGKIMVIAKNETGLDKKRFGVDAE